MKLISFKASGVHNRFNFNFKINDGITLITGKNGSGKTTALKFMDAFLQPDLGWISSVVFKNANISLIHNGSKISILAKRTKSVTRFVFLRDDEEIVTYEKPLNERGSSDLYRRLYGINSDLPKNDLSLIHI